MHAKKKPEEEEYRSWVADYPARRPTQALPDG
jgi:hypothetical protein